MCQPSNSLAEANTLLDLKSLPSSMIPSNAWQHALHKNLGKPMADGRSVAFQLTAGLPVIREFLKSIPTSRLLGTDPPTSLEARIWIVSVLRLLAPVSERSGDFR
jgi:hypothetical protein